MRCLTTTGGGRGGESDRFLETSRLNQAFRGSKEDGADQRRYSKQVNRAYAK